MAPVFIAAEPFLHLKMARIGQSPSFYRSHDARQADSGGLPIPAGITSAESAWPTLKGQTHGHSTGSIWREKVAYVGFGHRVAADAPCQSGRSFHWFLEIGRCLGHQAANRLQVTGW